MDVDHLVKMANEIGSFFAGASPPEQAPRDVATHLRRYWEPRMRKAMLAHFAKGGAGLTDVARRAVAILAAEAGAAGATSAAGATGTAQRAGQGPSAGANPPPGKA
ncbi:MAG TPA: formate dehydrogenase subunit delta [Steroidobacteraceae bacterium]